MNEIEKQIRKTYSELTTGIDSETGKEMSDQDCKNVLKRLIELIEKKQVHNCTNAHCLGAHPNGELEWDIQAIDRTQDAPRVSEKIDWEEL